MRVERGYLTLFIQFGPVDKNPMRHIGQKILVIELIFEPADRLDNGWIQTGGNLCVTGIEDMIVDHHDPVQAEVRNIGEAGERKISRRGHHGQSVRPLRLRELFQRLCR